MAPIWFPAYRRHSIVLFIDRMVTNCPLCNSASIIQEKTRKVKRQFPAVAQQLFRSAGQHRQQFRSGYGLRHIEPAHLAQALGQAFDNRVDFLFNGHRCVYAHFM